MSTLLPHEELELQRLRKLTLYEEEARTRGFMIIAGVDEAGRGPLAGPVVAAACIIPHDLLIPGVNDSKQLTPKLREELFEIIISDPRIVYGIGIIDHEEIDKVNIYQATILAMLKAVSQLDPQPQILLVDGLALPHPTIPVQKIVQGDALSHSIAAASIIAKETRDRLMIKYHEDWPHYGFNTHKGYGTPKHLEAISAHGPCHIHRRSFEPIKSLTR